MSFKQPLSTISTSDHLDSYKIPNQIKYLSKFNFCQVCGDKAHIINYGVLSCQSCKTFFRRNALHPENVRSCLFNRSCKINMETRRHCAACRLAKCLLVGMNSDLIRKEVQQSKKRLSTITSHSHQNMAQLEETFEVPIYSSQLFWFRTMLFLSKSYPSILQLPSLNLLHNYQLSLTNSEWILLSNVIHAHDKFTAIPQIRRTIENLSRSSLLHMSYNVSNVWETVILMYRSMKPFISSSPDFRILTINEQYSLFQRNLHGVVALCSSLYFATTGIIDNPTSMEIFTKIYGSEMMFQAKRIAKRLDSDLTIIKLMLIILAFSSNCFIIHRKGNIYNDSLLNGTFRLYGSQNVYVELLWKYMIYRYGYYGSVVRFFRLIENLLDLIKYAGVIYTSNHTHYHLVEYIFEQTKQSLIIDQNEDRPLWGKT